MKELDLLIENYFTESFETSDLLRLVEQVMGEQTLLLEADELGKKFDTFDSAAWWRIWFSRNWHSPMGRATSNSVYVCWHSCRGYAFGNFVSPWQNLITPSNKIIMLGLHRDCAWRSTYNCPFHGIVDVSFIHARGFDNK